jgi:hypothetical protein
MNARSQVWELVARLIFDRCGSELAACLRSEAAAAPGFWAEVISTANAYFVTAPLWTALLENGLHTCVPDDEAAYLKSFHDLNRTRNQAVRAQLLQCMQALNGHGIEPMPIKGAAYMMSGLHADVGDRFFTDIDLLLPEGSVERAADILREIGYSSVPAPELDDAAHHHLAPLVRDDAPAAVELHRAAVPAPAQPALPVSSLWNRAAARMTQGVHYLVPSPSDAAMLSFLHTEVADGQLSLYVLPLRALHDMVLLQRRHGAEIDWSENVRRAAAIGAQPQLRRYLHALYRISGVRPVEELRFSRSDALHFWLSRAAIAWPPVSRWIFRANRFSGRTIRERYHVAGGALDMTVCRIREIGAMMSRGFGKT